MSRVHGLSYLCVCVCAVYKSCVQKSFMEPPWKIFYKSLSKRVVIFPKTSFVGFEKGVWFKLRLGEATTFVPESALRSYICVTTTTPTLLDCKAPKCLYKIELVIFLALLLL